MHFYNLPLKYNGNIYFFNKYLGLLLYRKESFNENQIDEEIPSSILKDYQLVLQPYNVATINNSSVYVNVSIVAKIYTKLLVLACEYSFLLARVITNLPLIRFSDTKQALQVFALLYPSSMQRNTLCLPRTLFVIATSKSFKKNGTAFIGVFLPTRKMHAWIIEGSSNPDTYDNNWILYQPVIAITK